MSDSPDDDRPWTEEQWLAEFRQSDVRSARFGELLETLADHPDRDAIIAREMGWDHDDEDGESFEASDFDAKAEMEAALSEVESWEPDDAAADDDADETDDEPVDELHEDDEEDRAEGLPLLSDVPAFQTAMELAHFVIDLGNRQGELTFADLRNEELFSEVLGNVLIPAAKLRGGHTYGYDDNICANIVCNRFALEAAEKAERALVELHATGTLPAEYQADVLPRIRTLVELLHERIAEMRTRVWW